MFQLEFKKCLSSQSRFIVSSEKFRNDLIFKNLYTKDVYLDIVTHSNKTNIFLLLKTINKKKTQQWSPQMFISTYLQFSLTLLSVRVWICDRIVSIWHFLLSSNACYMQVFFWLSVWFVSICTVFYRHYIKRGTYILMPVQHSWVN